MNLTTYEPVIEVIALVLTMRAFASLLYRNVNDLLQAFIGNVSSRGCSSPSCSSPVNG
jgi:hypothetical protein